MCIENEKYKMSFFSELSMFSDGCMSRDRKKLTNKIGLFNIDNSHTMVYLLAYLNAKPFLFYLKCVRVCLLFAQIYNFANALQKK